MLIYGFGGHASVIKSLLSNSDFIGFFDEINKIDAQYLGIYNPLVYPNEEIIIGIGDNYQRKIVSESIKHKFAKIVSQSSIIDSTVEIDFGTVAMQGTIIQANAKIGTHVIINTSASVDHDCIIDDFVHISPHSTLCGNVKIGEGTHVGAAAVVIPGIKIGKWCTIGAGAVIIKDVPDYAVVVGNPGKIIKSNNSNKLNER